MQSYRLFVQRGNPAAARSPSRRVQQGLQSENSEVLNYQCEACSYNGTGESVVRSYRPALARGGEGLSILRLTRLIIELTVLHRVGAQDGFPV